MAEPANLAEVNAAFEETWARMVEELGGDEQAERNLSALATSFVAAKLLELFGPQKAREMLRVVGDSLEAADLAGGTTHGTA